MIVCERFFRQFNDRKPLFIALSFLLSLHLLWAQDETGLHQAFLDLSHDGVVMNLSAHPDDEDGSTLAYYRMKYGVRTYSLLFTRGEGGQNEIGPELYEELGVLRTHETEAAGRILGARIRFLNLYDFGFSKTATETFQKWGGANEVLRRLVYAIRKYKPDVLFTNHNTIGGHGHHQAVAITAIAAFDAAADSTIFPEQLKLPGAAVWQPRKLFFRVFGRDAQQADVIHAIGDTNAVLKRSYLDVAAEAIAMHRSQGLDGSRMRAFTQGRSLYRLVRSNSMYANDSTTFFGGINLWNDPALQSLYPLRRQLLLLHEGMSRDSLLAIISNAQTETDRLSPTITSPLARRILEQWQEELEELVRLSLGISASWMFADTLVVPRQRVPSTVRLHVPGFQPDGLQFSFITPHGWTVNDIEQGASPSRSRAIERKYEVIIGDDAHLTYPKTKANYNPIELEQSLAVIARFSVLGLPLRLTLRPSFDVGPLQLLHVAPSITRISPDEFQYGKKFSFELKNLAPRKTAGRITVEAPATWRCESATYVIPQEDGVARGELLVTPPPNVGPGDYALRFKSEYAWTDVTVKVFDVTVDRTMSLGIIKSYDDTMEETARALGVKYKLLTAHNLEGDLSAYTTIVVDIRAYFARDDLRKANRRLLEYVRNGGHVVVMYQKDQDWKPEYAPYPFHIGRKRITVEEAPVNVLVPEHPLFSSPNKIVDDDWKGWIQERGIYFPEKVPSEYMRLLSCSDPDEAPLTTGYLLTHYGKGSYIYTSYVWYRQLKEYHAGAYRCFANMISYPRYRDTANPGRTRPADPHGSRQQ
ncbi:MAG TPA: PIG-L family deacetylase [Bacteroidota bacterium]|nr:PIG-L family deacetylase [Bacteroidota bacterium]